MNVLVVDIDRVVKLLASYRHIGISTLQTNKSHLDIDYI